MSQDDRPPPATTRPPGRAAGHLLASLRAFAGRRGALAVALVAAAALFEGASLLLIVPILTLITTTPVAGIGQQVARWLDGFGATGPHAQLGVLLALFALIMLLRAAVLYRRDIVLAQLQIGFVEAQRNRVIRALAWASWPTVAGLRHARINNLMSAEIQRLGASVQYLIQGSVAAAMLLIQAGLALALAPGLAAAILLLLGLWAAALMAGQRHVRDLGSEVVRSSQQLMGSAGQLLGGLKIAAAQRAQAWFVAQFETFQTELRSQHLLFIERQARSRRNFGLASALGGAAMVFAGYVWFALSPAVLIALIVVFARMSGPALLMQQAAQNFFFGVGSFEAIDELVDDLATPAPPPAAPAPVLPDGAIELCAVDYAHPQARGLRNIQLRIEPGAFVGIAGASGAGKTTLIDLLAGLIVPQQGEVRVGGTPLGPANTGAWQEQIGYVAQDNYLFHASIGHNLAWGAPIGRDALDRALTLVGADALIARLPDGLDTIVGERGALLSGGERQRLNLARGLLRNPRLLILDEATNALDPAAERELLARLAGLTARPAIVMISHRPGSLVHCDRIVRIEDGVVADAPADGHADVHEAATDLSFPS